ncbi:hypothetical protein CSB37_02745 [bacterium DOLZORAL124_38_8]|nr:MAG: hypothetical protein CSB37_02745 [bacterium DOLZORAL124_38_8]
MKKYLYLSLLALVSVFCFGTNVQAKNTQAALSPSGTCRVFLDESYVPKDWQHISRCPKKRRLSATHKRTVKALPKYLRQRTAKSQPKTLKKYAPKPKLRNLRPRKTIAKHRLNRRRIKQRKLPNYRTNFWSKANKFQKTRKTESRRTIVRPYRNYRISASRVTKNRNDNRNFSGRTWKNYLKDRRRHINKLNSKKYWRSINSLQSETIKKLKPKAKPVHAKLKKRYVGAPRKGSLDNVSLSN